MTSEMGALKARRHRDRGSGSVVSIPMLAGLTALMVLLLGIAGSFILVRGKVQAAADASALAAARAWATEVEKGSDEDREILLSGALGGQVQLALRNVAASYAERNDGDLRGFQVSLDGAELSVHVTVESPEPLWVVGFKLVASASAEVEVSEACFASDETEDDEEDSGTEDDECTSSSVYLVG